MKHFAYTLVAVSLLMTLVPVHAQGECLSSFTLVTTADSKWVLEGQTVKNPTITNVCKSTEITVTMKQGEDALAPHNLKIGDGPTSTQVTEPGETVDYTYTTPASGTVKYVCVIHGTPMSGELVIEGTASPTETKDSPGFAAVGLVIGVLGAAVLLRRK